MSESVRKSAIITGAAQGIGRSIALQLASDGYAVAISDTQVEKLQLVVDEITSKGQDAVAYPGDVTKKEVVQGLVAKAVETFGGLDVMVANAGILQFQAIQDVDEDDWDLLMSTNVRSAMMCFKYAALQMIQQGRGGSIIGASSISGKRAVPAKVAYNTSKFAIRGLVQSSALDLGKYGIRVNAYAAGVIDTELLRGALGITPVPSSLHELKPMTALQEIGRPEDIAGLVSYLVSPAGRFITGQSINVDGGSVFD